MRDLLDHDDFGLNQLKIMNAVDSNKFERDSEISSCNLRERDCTGKAQRRTFPHPALAPLARLLLPPLLAIF